LQTTETGATIGLMENVSTMRLPRLRFTVRQMMVAVAIMAVALSGGIAITTWKRR
jgi:hypothetical protein